MTHGTRTEAACLAASMAEWGNEEAERAARHYRAMTPERRVELEADVPANPVLSLDGHIASARRDMGEARWAELNAEWRKP